MNEQQFISHYDKFEDLQKTVLIARDKLGKKINICVLHYIKVNARYCLRIFASPVTCSNKLSLISLLITRSGNTINTRQNKVKVSNPRQFTAGKSFIAENQRKLGQMKDIWRRKCQLRNSKYKHLPYIKKSGTNMCSYLCRGNGSHVWLFYDLASSILHGNVSKKATKTEKLPRKTWKLR